MSNAHSPHLHLQILFDGFKSKKSLKQQVQPGPNNQHWRVLRIF